MCLGIYQSLCISQCLYSVLSFSPFTCPSTCLFLLVSLSIYLPISVLLSIHLPIYLCPSLYLTHLVAVVVDEASHDFIHALSLLALIHLLHEVEEECQVHLALSVLDDEGEEVVHIGYGVLEGLTLDHWLHGFLQELHCHCSLLFVHLEGKLEGNVGY